MLKWVSGLHEIRWLTLSTGLHTKHVQNILTCLFHLLITALFLTSFHKVRDDHCSQVRTHRCRKVKWLALALTVGKFNKFYILNIDLSKVLSLTSLLFSPSGTRPS
jgi:hypothetical protein